MSVTSQLQPCNKDTVTIVINSCIANIAIPLQRLLESIKRYNTEFRIISIVGGSENESIVSDSPLYTTVFTKHNSIDFTGLITILETPIPQLITPFIFYMHDTCEVGPTFFVKLSSLHISADHTYGIWSPGMNIGIYSIDILQKVRTTVLEQKNTIGDMESIQYFKALGVPREDIIFKTHNHHKVIRSKRTVSEPYDYYNTGVMRKVEYYEAFDLYKIKANWRPKHIYELNP